MPDATVTVTYNVTSITHSDDDLSIVAWTLAHAGTGLSEVRTDRFSSAALASGVDTTVDSSATKEAKVKANLETLGRTQLKNFAKRVKTKQSQTDIEEFDPGSGSVSGLSLVFTGEVEVAD